MLIALALLAADLGAASPPAELMPKYVADYVPAKGVSLDAKRICTDGFVDPGKLAVQLMIQLEMFDELRTMSGEAALLTFDGSECPDRIAGKPPVEAKQKSACTASIVVQRLLLNVYTGYMPTVGAVEGARTHKLVEGDLERDVASARMRRAVVEDFTATFLTSPAGHRLVECDFAEKPTAIADGTEPEPTTLERSGTGADLAEFGVRFARGLRVLQFRQYAGNLVYRGAGDSYDSVHATFASGRDLYATDAGFSINLSKELGDEARADYFRQRKETIVGAIGIPLCGLRKLEGKDCQSENPVEEVLKSDSPAERRRKEARRTFTYDVIPFVALDRGFKKTRPLATPGDLKKEVTGDLLSYGAVGYLATDDGPENCALWGALDRLTNCASYYVARVFRLENDLDESKLEAVSLRYTPLVKTSSPGLKAFDFCLNSVCGDPDRFLRTGVLFDLRYNQGWYKDPGNLPLLQELNQDYARIGGRIGVIGVVKLLPDVPINFWAAYTDFEPLKGFDRDLGQTQAQISVTFSAATISLDYRNGRREDTAKRDSTYALKVGFKTK